MPRRPRFPRSSPRLNAVIVSVVAALTLVSCNQTTTETVDTLAIGIGFESVTDPDTDWSKVREQFDATEVEHFTISMGRPEWIGFPWPGQQESWAPATRNAAEDDRDLLQEALDALTKDSDRSFTLTLDVLSPETVRENPQTAGAFPDGSAAESFPSASALYSGKIGDRIEQMCAAAAERYLPQRIALTELLGDTFFLQTTRSFTQR